MIVEQIMRKEVSTLGPHDTIEKAIEVMGKEDIRHIPIIDKHGILVGIISDRDIRDASPSIFELVNEKQFLSRPIEDIMKWDVITGHPLDFVEEISAIFYEHRIGCLPIVNHEKLVGIVTEADLLYTFIQLTGGLQPGSQIEVKVPNLSGSLAEVSSIIQQKNVNILSVLVYPDFNDQFKILVFRIQTMNPMSVIESLRKSGYEVLWPNLPGISS
ncbi:acetoin utilization AcuB family protein [Bacillus carboniphilus]|uniref:Acetoin utilization AcuB family protein n=1 Tax=Bacillus carboniphilus TaxID=86663 RepID=A0ABY9JXU4_9BACI|nr:acetoin utilization AcuB family protein [Bacillus carboniphilus]WLR44202.1 acetoin utilization AcuB family protein [Bacillus carboniphilus]